MPATYTAAVKTARMTATRDHFADGTIEILTAADVVLVSVGLSPGGGAVAGSVWTLTLDAASVAATGAGVATKARLKTALGAADLTDLVVVSQAAVDADPGIVRDIIMDNTSVAVGQIVNVSNFTVTHA